MREEEFCYIQKILEEEIKNNDIASLMKVRDYLNRAIAMLSGTVVSIEEHPELFQTLDSFINTNILDKQVGVKGNFKKNILLIAIGHQKGICDRPVFVCDTLGIDQKALSRTRGLGKYTLNLYEEALNRCGLSMKMVFNAEQRDQLENNLVLKRRR